MTRVKDVWTTIASINETRHPWNTSAEAIQPLLHLGVETQNIFPYTSVTEI